MEIKIFGPGCAKCTATERAVLAVVQEMGRDDIKVEKIRDIKKMMEAGVMSTPALSLNGKVVCTGRVPDKKEIMNWILGACPSGA